MNKSSFLLTVLSMFFFLLPSSVNAQNKKTESDLEEIISSANKLSKKTIKEIDMGNSPAQAIDLGLPSGVKWASCNVGATKPEESGDFFAWGETTIKKKYEEDNYRYCIGSLYVDLGQILERKYDVAHQKWGGSWRMPTKEECKELFEKCKYEKTTLNGVKGAKFIGSNGNSVFLPLAGMKIESFHDQIGIYGYYWSSTQDPKFGDFAYGLYIGNVKGCWGSWYLRGYGLTVRPVISN